MTCTRTATLPVSPDEAFALITEPERLRRWQTVSAVVDLRAGGDYPLDRLPRPRRGRHLPRGRAGHARRLRLGLGGQRRAAAGRLDGHGHHRAGSGGVHGDAGPRGPRRGAGADARRGLGPLPRPPRAAGHDRRRRSGRVGRDSREPRRRSVAAEAVLAVVQPVLRGLTTEDRPSRRRAPTSTATPLAVHLMGSLVGLGAMAGVTVVDAEGRSLENKVSVMAAQAIDGWRTVDLDGTVTGPRGSEMPASFAAGILPFELLLHGWDLAQASRPAAARLRRGGRLPAQHHRAADAVGPRARRSFGRRGLPPPTTPARSTGSRRTPAARRSPPDLSATHPPTRRTR